MQNKGFVKVFAILLALVCLFYLSFTGAEKWQERKAAKISAAQGAEAGQHYLDSMQNEPFYLGVYTLKECREMGIGLGLDLKGGMNVILEVSVPEVVKALADHKDEPAFNQAIAAATKASVNDRSGFITLFVKEYKRLAPEARLAELFATQQLKGKVNTKSTDAEVEKVLREEVKVAIENSYNVLRNRIDRFGVVQPNIQSVKGEEGRIMVEMPGIKEPDRVRKLLQGSANLEFWETYNTMEAVPFLVTLDRELASAGVTSSAESAVEETAVADSAQAVSADTLVQKTADLATAVKGATGAAQASGDKQSAEYEKFKKEHPLFAVLQVAQGNMGCVVGYANWRDTAAVNRFLASDEAKAVLPADLRLKWGVKGLGKGQSGDIYELYAIKVTERNGRAPLEGDVVSEANDEFDQNNRPCVSMTMNTDGARRWAALTKANQQRCIAIVLDDCVYSAPQEIEVTLLRPRY